MSRLKKTLAILLTNSGLLTGIYLGNMFYYDINKMWLNSFEKRTPVEEGYFQNISDLKIFYEKRNGKFIPCYGLDDKKISIGSDLLPKGFFDYENRYIPFTKKDSIKQLTQNQIEYINALYSNDNISDSLIYLIEALNIYKKSDGIKKDAMRYYIKKITK